jgi:hypothetical protein
MKLRRDEVEAAVEVEASVLEVKAVIKVQTSVLEINAVPRLVSGPRRRQPSHQAPSVHLCGARHCNPGKTETL